MTIQSRLASLGIALLPPSQPAGSYVGAVRTGNLVFLSDKGPRQADGSLAKGKVGSDVSVAAAQAHARSTAIGLLSALHAELGDLERVRRVVKVLGFVEARRRCCPRGSGSLPRRAAKKHPGHQEPDFAPRG
jgi:enamine deaminase RidA (YjgF/YER057c/UK114 family)